MRRTFTKALKREFDLHMRRSLPGFEKIQSAFGGVVYRRKTDEGHYLFVFLLPSPQLERFTLEIAISDGEGYPFGILPGSRKSVGRSRHRIRSLLKTNGDGWWYIDESRIPALSELVGKGITDLEGLARIPRLVEDACDKLGAAISVLLELERNT